MLGANAQENGPADVRRQGGRAGGGDRHRDRGGARGLPDHEPQAAVVPLNPASEEIHRRHTDQRGDEAIGGPAVEGQGVGHLLQAPLAEDRHPLAQRHGLGLIVGDIDGGCAQAVVEAADFALQLAAQGGFQVRERLIEEEEFGLADQGPAQGDALPLSAGELTGAAVQEVVDAQRGGGGADAALDLRLGGPPQGEAEGEVAPDRQVGIDAPCWKTMATWRWRGGRPSSTCPSRTMLPRLGGSRPAIIRRTVVLPQPEGPTNTSTSPSATSRERSSTARTPPGKVLAT